tara:strand:+ start:1994 stop:2161 length:168 start_codon:yes stop_codon:yes gene_type:complete
MGYFSGLHLEMTLRGELDNYEPQEQDYDPEEEKQSSVKKTKRPIKTVTQEEEPPF